MKTALILCLSVFAWLNALAASGKIILLNGTSSAGKSSLAEAITNQFKTKYEVISFDDFRRTYTDKQRLARWGFKEYSDVMAGLYRYAKDEANAGRNVVIDTVEFDRNHEKYCEILDCPQVIKAIVYCPLQDLMKRIDRRNNSGVPSNRRPVLLSFQQFVDMYKPQASPDELVVDKTRTTVLRTALIEAGKKANNPAKYDALYKEYVKEFGIDQDKEIVIVARGRYDLVLNTRANTKKENVQTLEDALIKRDPTP